jgi:hypothetical protein
MKYLLRTPDLMRMFGMTARCLWSWKKTMPPILDSGPGLAKAACYTPRQAACIALAAAVQELAGTAGNYVADNEQGYPRVYDEEAEEACVKGLIEKEWPKTFFVDDGKPYDLATRQLAALVSRNLSRLQEYLRQEQRPLKTAK